MGNGIGPAGRGEGPQFERSASTPQPKSKSAEVGSRTLKQAQAAAPKSTIGKVARWIKNQGVNFWNFVSSNPKKEAVPPASLRRPTAGYGVIPKKRQAPPADSNYGGIPGKMERPRAKTEYGMMPKQTSQHYIQLPPEDKDAAPRRRSAPEASGYGSIDWAKKEVSHYGVPKRDDDIPTPASSRRSSDAGSEYGVLPKKAPESGYDVPVFKEQQPYGQIAADGGYESLPVNKKDGYGASASEQQLIMLTDRLATIEPNGKLDGMTKAMINQWIEQTNSKDELNFLSNNGFLRIDPADARKMQDKIKARLEELE